MEIQCVLFMWYAGRNPFVESSEPIIMVLHFMSITSRVCPPERPRRSGRTLMMRAYHFLLPGCRNTAASGLSAQRYSASVPNVSWACCIIRSRCEHSAIFAPPKLLQVFLILLPLRLIRQADSVFPAVGTLFRLLSAAENKMALITSKNHFYHLRHYNRILPGPQARI